MSKLLKHFLGYHYFIALCAMAYSMDLSWIVNEPLRDAWFYSFIFFSTFLAYNIYYIQDPKKEMAQTYSILGLLGSLISIFFTHTISWTILSAIVVLSSLYLFPILFHKTKNSFILWTRLTILTLVWTLTTSLLPLHSLDSFWDNGILIGIRFLFIWNLSLLFMIRDEASHFKIGILTQVLITSISLQFVLNILYAISHPYFSIAFILVTLLLCLVSWLTTIKPRSPYFYLGVVDGLMLLEATWIYFLTH